MPQDAFHIRRLANELNTFLVGGKINRISQANKDELTFIVYTGKSTVKLALSANASGARVCLSATEKEPAPVPPNFCMLLRKYLQGAQIIAVRQAGFERILELDFHCTTDFSESARTLYCELMGKYSNLVLCEKGVILGALKTTALEDNAHRILLAGAKYAYPAPQEKLSHLDGAGLRSRLKSYLETRREGVDEEGLSAWIFQSIAGLALPTAREIVSRAAASFGGVQGAVAADKDYPLLNFLADFCECEPNRPHLKLQGGEATDFFAFPIAGGVEAPSLCKAEDDYFAGKETRKGFADTKRKLENTARAALKKQTKKLQESLERLQEAEKAEQYRLQGELLTANLYRVEKGANAVVLENWYSESGEQVTISLDPTLSPAQNAQKLFKLYAKQKRAKEALTPITEKQREEIDYTQSVLCSIALSESAEDLKEIEAELIGLGLLRAPKARVGGKRKEAEIPFRRYEYGGYTILAGRNNLQNDRLLRSASPEDIWLHTQKYHSSHVIVENRGGQVCDEVLLYAAELCSYYSDGREGDKIPVDYCKRKFVKKPNKSKAGFVTYTDYKTLLVTPKSHAETVDKTKNL